MNAQDNQMNIIGKLHIQASFEKNSTLMDCLISNAVDEVIVSWYDSTSLGLHLAIEKASKIISERKDGKNSAKRASQEELVAKSLILKNDKNDSVLSQNVSHYDSCDKVLSHVIKNDNVCAGVKDGETLYCHGKLTPMQSSLCFTKGTRNDIKNRHGKFSASNKLKSTSNKQAVKASENIFVPKGKFNENIISNVLKSLNRKKPVKLVVKSSLGSAPETWSPPRPPSKKLRHPNDQVGQVYPPKLEKVKSKTKSTLRSSKEKSKIKVVKDDKQCNALIDNSTRTTRVHFKEAPILTSESIRVILLEEYGDILKEKLGKKLANFPPVKITLRNPPYDFPRPISVAKNIPLFQIPAAEETLKEELHSGVIEKVPLTDPAPEVVWRSVFVIKPNLSHLNRNVLRPYHNFLSAQQILKSLPHDAKFFAKWDLTQGYSQLLLDKESRKLTTFLLPQIGKEGGLYRYRSLPQSLSSAPDLFNHALSAAFSSLSQHFRLMDDILLFSNTLEGLLEKCRAFLDKCREYNLIVSPTKFEISEEIKYAGSIISSKGIRPNPEFIMAIAALPPPTTQTQVRGILGMANQLAGYTDQLAQITEPIRQLLQKKTSFAWNILHQTAFDQMKKLLCGPLILHFFNPDPACPPIVITDASIYGLGWVCVQFAKDDEEKKYPKLVAAGSRGLTPSEKRFSICELETLAITYTVRNIIPFYQFLDGNY